MNPPEIPNEKKNASSGTTPTDESTDDTSADESKATQVKIVESKKLTITNYISIGLLFVSAILAIVNLITYRGISDFNVKTIENYKIRNRPFVKLAPDHIGYIEQNEKGTKLQIDVTVKNFGQVPASVEATDIWIKNIKENSGDLEIWDSNKPYAIKKFALFPNDEPESFGRAFTLGNHLIDKIKKAKPVYVVFSIKYNALGIKEHLQEGPFFYWAKYRCNKFIPDKGEAITSFLIEECGDKEFKPSLGNSKQKQESEHKVTDTTSTVTVHTAAQADDVVPPVESK